MYLLLQFFLVVLPFFSGYDDVLTIKIKGIRGEKGAIKIGLYNYENQFPYQPYKSYVVEKYNLQNGVLVFEIEDLPEGKYALSFLDDENLNNEMDYNWLRIPIEGYGFSNDAKPAILGPPDYNDCTFYLKGNKKVEINLKYF